MMKDKDIQKLIDRFLDAETTLEEEKSLMDYFSQADIAEELMPYREMFLDYQAASGIDAMPEEMAIKEPAEKPVVKPVKGWLSVTKMYRWVAAAACVAVILALTLTLEKASTPDCIAYVGGKRITDKAVIEQLMHATVEDMQAPNIAEMQLQEMFETMD